jgi:hypothetical protein
MTTTAIETPSQETRLAEFKTALELASAAQIADIYSQIRDVLWTLDREHRERTSYDRAALDIAESLLRSKIQADFAADILDEQTAETTMRIAHDELDVKLVVKRRLDKRIADLRQLEGLVPADVLQLALHPDLPPPDKIPWVADARRLKKIAKEYGSKVAAIVDRGLRYVVVGQPQLVVEPKAQPEKNITPIAGEAQ